MSFKSLVVRKYREFKHFLYLLFHTCKYNRGEYAAFGWNADGTKRGYCWSNGATKRTCEICGRVIIEVEQR